MPEDLRDARRFDVIRFWTGALVSKWGFLDGELLDDFLWERFEAEGIDFRAAHHLSSERFDNTTSHAFLIEAVERFVLPKVREHHAIEHVRIQTCHNPIRICQLDGVEDPPETAEVRPEEVAVLRADLEALVREMFTVGEPR